MDEWILEADIYRYRKELADIDEGAKRQRLLDCLGAAEAMLARHLVDELALQSTNG